VKWLERLIELVAPGYALKRREAKEELRRRSEAAERSRAADPPELWRSADSYLNPRSNADARMFGPKWRGFGPNRIP